ncbi:dihydrofolate reductase [Sphingobacterium sp. N143]|uniref:dihydrofolate reductase family protein n=1 Tax=Sphingobacterium sp. N143 TaxID=2746727 RepID=UPI0025786128|nr:dihydrofolate reductase family protein [Sphingobacterium sp. N143]MDM1296365.1 dihydrofolate reductase [Sphingobacterium sp. N143]
MKKIIYYVASSLDGYISGVDDDVTGFKFTGKAIDKYLNDLQSFQTVIMGRNTYEFGYKFGAKPGAPSPTYAHMQHYIFSNNLTFDNKSDQVEVKKLIPEVIDKIKTVSETDIYLCGGGKLAGWLLENKKIDVIKLKVNPLILNRGTKLFEGIDTSYQLDLLESKSYADGIQLLTYKINYD